MSKASPSGSTDGNKDVTWFLAVAIHVRSGFGGIVDVVVVVVGATVVVVGATVVVVAGASAIRVLLGVSEAVTA